MPQVIGQTSAAKDKKSVSPQAVALAGQSDFLAGLEEIQDTRMKDAVRRLFQWAMAADIVSFTRWELNHIVIHPQFQTRSKSKRTVFQLSCLGTFYPTFQYLKSGPPFDNIDKRSQLLKRWTEISQFEMPHDAMDRRLGMPLQNFLTNERLDKLIGTFDYVATEIRNCN